MKSNLKELAITVFVCFFVTKEKKRNIKWAIQKPWRGRGGGGGVGRHVITIII
jgi:hypothetical protein